MKIRFVMGYLLAFVSMGTAYAQVPDDLLKERVGGEMKTFYQSERDGYAVIWSLITSPKGDGYGCGIGYMRMNTGLVMTHGPIDQSEAASDRGVFTLIGDSIPSARKPRIAQIVIRIGAEENKLTALHMSTGGKESMLRVPINIWQTVNEKDDAYALEVTMDGRKVFQADVVELQRAYKQLKTCMAPLGKR